VSDDRPKAREWWIGKTQNGYDKWLASKHPNETTCQNVFISIGGEEECVEYIPVVEKSALTEANERIEFLEKQVTRFLKLIAYFENKNKHVF
jgi:hypothetical protein